MTPLDYHLWGAVKNKCYADKPETIDALKDNVHQAIGEIQLHTIDNGIKNWTDRVGYYCMASRGSHLNEITCINGHSNPSVRIIDLVSHTIYVVCVLIFIHKWRDLQFKVDSERQFF